MAGIVNQLRAVLDGYQAELIKALAEDAATEIESLTTQRDALLAACVCSKAYEMWDFDEISLDAFRETLREHGWDDGIVEYEFLDSLREAAIALCPTPKG